MKIETYTYIDVEFYNFDQEEYDQELREIETIEYELLTTND